MYVEFKTQVGATGAMPLFLSKTRRNTPCPLFSAPLTVLEDAIFVDVKNRNAEILLIIGLLLFVAIFF